MLDDLLTDLQCDIEAIDYESLLQKTPDNSVDLILTDPPYCISRKTGFANLGKNSVERFAVSMDFGEWDHVEIDLDNFCRLSYQAIRSGGTIIVFYDLWKLTDLSKALCNAGFVQLRFIEWIKTNPVPLNSKRNYLTNSREIAILAVKNGKPTFHSEYDNGQYHYPIPNNGKRYHSTQKPLGLFRDLIVKHSNETDLVVDPFLGSGTCAVASVLERRNFIGGDLDQSYVDIAKMRVNEETE